MKILQILPALNFGGVETGTLDLAKYLVKKGHGAVVVSSGGALVKDLRAMGAVHYQLPVHKKSLIKVVKMIFELAKIIRKEDVDIIHARSRVPGWIAYFASRITGKVFITTCHGYYRKNFFSSVMGWGKRVIVLSNVIARHMIDDFAVPYERIKLIPRSVDLEKFKFIPPDNRNANEFHVGIVGRLTPLKGHLHFIKAMARVSQETPGLKIWIVGDAPDSKSAYREQIQDLTKRYGLWQRTQFLGVQKDIPAIMADLDVLVLATTTHEAFGRVIIEAQASGVCVVATRVGGVVDIIEDNQTGLLVPPAEPISMAEAVIKIYKDKNLRSNLASRAYEKVKEKYNLGLMADKTEEVYEDALSNLRILVIKLSSLGDIILSTPALRALRERFPAQNHKISLLIGEEYKDILLNCPYIDELIVFDYKYRDKGLRQLLNLSASLRKKNFDLIVDLQNNRKSHLLCALSLPLKSYGYNNKKLSFLLKKRVKNDKIILDPVNHQFRILKMLDIDLKDSSLELWPGEGDRIFAEEFLRSQWISGNQVIIGINISASHRWMSKNWPLHHLARLCEELAKRDMRVMLTGSKEDLKIANSLSVSLKNIKLINACAKTSINQLACLIRKCNVYISADSAPLHIAASQGVPLIALFGPTDPRRHMPYARRYILIKKTLSCSPCYKSKCRRKKCMEMITPEEVLEAIEKLLKTNTKAQMTNE
ncbi:MAG: lipopolysaccharide heptosyltransferase II [Candidatus Omnitrophota bacterium]|nr:MAG: lipopolysaccharide heptosyltransferase II [Candidatus Omnitrophota bacterium]